jgi:K+-transporting ATPase ATPase B chain
MKYQSTSIFTVDSVYHGFLDALKMLTPWALVRNPVMFVTYIAAVFTTIYVAQELYHGKVSRFDFYITFWLWLTVIFANFAEAIAENRGKAQAASLRKTQVEVQARLLKNGVEERVSITSLKKGDHIVCEVGDIIPVDGEVFEGVATIDESAITGESAPVIRESGGDRSAVTAGTRVVSDRLVITVVSEAGNTFLDRMINLIESAKRQHTPNEIALHIVLSALTIIFVVTVVSLKFFADYSGAASGNDLSAIVTIPVLLALLVCLIPTTISALLSAVGIAGMDRLIRYNVVAKSGRSVEAAGDVSLLILDKTGTITLGNRMATAFIPAEGITEKDFAEVAQIASLTDETPEGRSIVVLAKNNFGLRAESINIHDTNVEFIPFSAKTRMSGVDFKDANGKVVRVIRKGAIDAIRCHVKAMGGSYPVGLDEVINSIAVKGGTPLLVSENDRLIGIIHLKDVIKGGMKERFIQLRKMGIRTIMITGDNPLTAAAIAAEAGVDDYIAEATPEIKLRLIQKEQQDGHLVAMTGDGTNDAPALAQADVGVAMNAGTQASREAGNMVDLDNNPTKLIDIVGIGKQLLMTRGALTTFSIANDIAKYFAIIPAIFSGLYVTHEVVAGPLSFLNVMHLHSHKSAILSAVIFNALIIIALIPLALKGVSYTAQPANVMLRNNILYYGIGGIVLPFVGIKMIDLLIEVTGVAL